MRIDIHTHAFSAHKAPEVLAGLIAKARRDCPVTPHGNGTLDDLVRQECEDGFDRFAVCPIAVRPEQYGYMVRFLTAIRSGACGEEAARRVIPCASLHPADPEAEAHLRTLLSLGVRMLKLHPYFQNVRLDSRVMIRFLRMVTDAGLPVLCHTGHDVSYGWEGMASPAQILRVHRHVPGLRMICAHCAAWRNPEAEKLLLGRKIYVDLSYQPNGGTEDLIRRFALEHPQDYILFGSDWPWSRPAEHAARIASWGLSPARSEALFGGNAARLLGL